MQQDIRAILGKIIKYIYFDMSPVTHYTLLTSEGNGVRKYLLYSNVMWLVEAKVQLACTKYLSPIYGLYNMSCLLNVFMERLLPTTQKCYLSMNQEGHLDQAARACWKRRVLDGQTEDSGWPVLSGGGTQALEYPAWGPEEMW